MANEIRFPFIYLPDPTKGKPIFNGNIYIGVACTDPKVPSNQLDVYYIDPADCSQTPILISQPIKTNFGGVPIGPANQPVTLVLLSATEYSLTIDDKNDNLKYQVEKVQVTTSGGTPVSVEGLGGLTQYEFKNVSDAIAGITVGGEVVDLQPPFSARTQGRSSPGDGGHGDYLVVTGGTGTDDGGSFITLNNGNQIQLKIDENTNVLQWGADKTGVTSSDTAFINYFAYFNLLATTSPFGDSDLRDNLVLRYPPGTYLLTADGALMDGSSVNRRFGLNMQGAGRGMTRINYQPGGPSYSLMIYDDSYKFGGMRGFEISCGGANASTADFANVLSSGGVGGIYHKEMRFIGTWRRLFYFNGTNTGSEFSWYECELGGSYTDAVFFWGSDSNDQFVNYWFHNCNLGPTEGDGFSIGQGGGSVNIRGGSWSALSERTLPGFFFNLTDGDKFSGAPRLDVEGLRIEYKGSGLMRLLNCKWKQGNISFKSIQDDINVGGEQPPLFDTVFVESENAGGALITWDNCTLSGVHNYSGGGAVSWQNTCNYIYRECEFREADQPKDFITEPVTTTNPGDVPVIEFSDCRGQQGTLQQGSDKKWDEMYNWQRSSRGAPKARSMKFARFDGLDLPSSAENDTEFRLPLNAIITGVTYFKAANGTFTGTTWEYEVRSDPDGANILVDSYAGGTDWSLGFAQTNNVSFQADTEAKRELRLVAINMGSVGGDGYVVVNYIA